MVDCVTHNTDTNTMVFNIMYNSQTLESQKKTDQSGTSSAAAPNTSLSGTSSNRNNVHIDIDYNNLKRFAPHLDSSSPQGLKDIASALSKAIKVGKEGNVLVDSAQLDARSFQLRRSDISKDEQDLGSSNLPKDLKSSTSGGKRTVLAKCAKFCGTEKYLIVINSMERMPTIYNPNKTPQDDGFEQYEIYLEVVAACLSSAHKQKLVWEISLEHLQKLIHLTEPIAIAKHLINVLQVFNDRFLLAVNHRSMMHFSNVNIINEKTLRAIQRKFISRKFQLNYKYYNQELKKISPFIVCKTILEFQNFSFIAVGVDEQKDKVQVILWSASHYDKLDVEVEKKLIQGLYNKDKQKAFKIIMKNLSFSKEEDGHIQLTVKQKSLMDDLADTANHKE